VLAAWAATRLVRACAAEAFEKNGRSTTTVEIIKHIGPVFDRLFETKSK
jgi:ATP-dependent NAD(P)H-hydrate dehydratase